MLFRSKAIVEELRDNTTPLRRDWEASAMAAAHDTYEKILKGAGDWAKENALVKVGKLTLSDPGGEAV